MHKILLSYIKFKILKQNYISVLILINEKAFLEYLFN